MNVRRIHSLKITGPLALAVVALPFSIALSNLALIILGIAWITDGSWRLKWETLTGNPLVLPFVLFFLLHLLAISYSSDKEVARFSLEKKVFFITVPLILASIKLEKEDVRFLLNIFIISCLTGTLICLGVAYSKAWQGMAYSNFDIYSASAFHTLNTQAADTWNFLSYIELSSGIGIHPTYFSLYLIFCVLILIHFHATAFFEYRFLKRLIIILTLLYLSVFIIFLSSRIMTLSFFLISIYGVVQFLRKAPLFTKLIFTLLFSCVFVGVLYLNPVSRFRNYQEVVTTWPFLKPGLQTQSTTIRASLWSLSLKSLTRVNYFTGVGTGNVEHLIQKTANKYGISNILNTNDPHSQYLHTLLGLGVIGLVILLSCFVIPSVIAYRSQNYFYLMFIGLFFMICLTESALEVQKGIVFFSLFSSLFLFQPSSINVHSFHGVKA